MIKICFYYFTLITKFTILDSYFTIA